MKENAPEIIIIRPSHSLYNTPSLALLLVSRHRGMSRRRALETFRLAADLIFRDISTPAPARDREREVADATEMKIAYYILAISVVDILYYIIIDAMMSRGYNGLFREFVSVN